MNSGLDTKWEKTKKTNNQKPIKQPPIHTVTCIKAPEKRSMKKILQVSVLVMSVLAHFNTAFRMSYIFSAEKDQELWDPLVWTTQRNQREETHL